MDAEIFLTLDEAKSALYMDLESYGLQEETLVEMATLAGDPWLSRLREEMRGDAGCMERVAHLFGEFMESPQITEAVLCSLLSLLFWGSVHPARDGQGRYGVILGTGLGAFTCLNCGQCCTQLDYQGALVPDDIAMWEAAGRDDILAWVAPGVDEGAFTIWVHPDTGEIVTPCPFLDGETGTHRCAIHELKPAFCREYPATQKHGLLTDCPGVIQMVMGERRRVIPSGPR